MRNRQKSSYRQCWIPSTLKDKIVKFLFMFKPSKNPLTRAICWKSLRSVSFSHSWLTGLNCFIQASCWSCCWFHEVSFFDGLACGTENIYFWLVNTSLLTVASISVTRVTKSSKLRILTARWGRRSKIALKTPPEISRRIFWCNKNFWKRKFQHPI